MRRFGAGALALLTLTHAGRGDAQDSSAATHHLLALDISRVHPFERTYDMMVRVRDSTVNIGRRRVALTASTYAGGAAWLIVETRSGAVASVDSLYVATDLRPMHWSSALGAARLGVEFVGDTMYGAATVLGGKQNLVVNGQPDLIVSSPMLEALLPLLPLTSDWSDSVAVLDLNSTSNAIIPGQIAVLAEESVERVSSGVRLCWIVALRAGGNEMRVWVDKETGEPLRARQRLLAHVGSELEYRWRADSSSVP